MFIEDQAIRYKQTTIPFAIIYPSYVGQTVFISESLENFTSDEIQTIFDILRKQYPLLKSIRYRTDRPSNLVNFTQESVSTDMLKTQQWFQLSDFSIVRKLSEDGEKKRMQQNLSVSFEYANPEDYEEIFNMVNELAEHEKDENFNSFENFVKSFNDKNFKVLIAKKEKQCLGYAIFFPLNEEEIYLQDLFVRSEFRAFGIASAFFVKIFDQKFSPPHIKGQEKTLNWLCLNNNDLALGFYKKIGAEPKYGHLYQVKVHQ